MHQSLRLLHFHIGSQVPNIITIKNAVIEATRYYCQLVSAGFPMGYLDVGGGLGIDYDGSRTNFESSINYSLEEYARDVVFNIREICQSMSVPVPDIVSESGRAVAAPHSVLVIEVFERISKEEALLAQFPAGPRHKLVEDLQVLLRRNGKYSRLERFHDALQKKEEAAALFNLGFLDLSGPGPGGVPVLADLPPDRRRGAGRRLPARGTARAAAAARRPVRLQLLRLPIAARPLGAQATLPDRADSPAQRATIGQCDPRRHHLRLRRQDQSVHRSAGRA